MDTEGAGGVGGGGMMSRSEAVKSETLVLDNFRCQICGYNGEDLAERGMLHVHHVKPLGMGGSDSLDTVENCVTLCQKCHGLIHRGCLKIEKWIRGEELSVFNVEKHFHMGVWFDGRNETSRLQEIEARIQGLAMIEGDVARDLYELSKGYMLLAPDMVSFAQYIAGRNVSATKATQAARAYGWMDEGGLEWPVGLTSEKADIIRKAVGWELGCCGSEGEANRAQALLDAAVDQSVSDLKQELIDAGLMKGTVRWYVHIRASTIDGESPIIGGQVMLIRARKVEKALVSMRYDPISRSDMMLRADKFVAGLDWDRKTGILSDRDGNEIPYKDLT